MAMPNPVGEAVFRFSRRFSMKRLFCVVAFLGSFAVSLPSGADAQPGGKKAQKVPEALVDFGEFAENIYDLSKASDWAKAGEKYKALKDVVKALPGDLKETKPQKKHREETVAALGKALGAKEKLPAMRAAN